MLTQANLYISGFHFRPVLMGQYLGHYPCSIMLEGNSSGGVVLCWGRIYWVLKSSMATWPR